MKLSIPGDLQFPIENIAFFISSSRNRRVKIHSCSQTSSSRRTITVSSIEVWELDTWKTSWSEVWIVWREKKREILVLVYWIFCFICHLNERRDTCFKWLTMHNFLYQLHFILHILIYLNHYWVIDVCIYAVHYNRHYLQSNIFQTSNLVLNSSIRACLVQHLWTLRNIIKYQLSLFLFGSNLP